MTAFNKCEECSRQEINTSKSTSTFGARIPKNKQETLQTILDILNQGDGGKYL